MGFFGIRLLGTYVVWCRVRFSFHVYCLPQPSKGHLYLFLSDSTLDEGHCSMLSWPGDFFFSIFVCISVDVKLPELESESPLPRISMLWGEGDGGGANGASSGGICDGRRL